MEETSIKKQKVTPLKSDDSIKLVKEVLSREREIMTRSSVLKGSKNFTHAINLAKQLVLGKEVPPAGRSNPSQKSGIFLQRNIEPRQNLINSYINSTTWFIWTKTIKRCC